MNNKNNNKGSEAIMKNIQRELLKLELQGLIENKELFYLEEVLKTTKKQRIEKVYNNLYIIPTNKGI
jgi:hypothetical protein